MMSVKAAGSLPWGPWFKCNNISLGEPRPKVKTILTQTWGGDAWVFSEAPTHHAEGSGAEPGAPQELCMVAKVATKFMRGLF